MRICFIRSDLYEFVRKVLNLVQKLLIRTSGERQNSLIAEILLYRAFCGNVSKGSKDSIGKLFTQCQIFIESYV